VTDEQQDEQFYRDTESVAFTKLDDHQLSLLEPLGQRRVASRGEVVYKAGQRDIGLTVVLRGEIQVFERRDDVEQELAVGHERDFIGDVAMLQGTSALATARVTSDEAEILYVPAAELQRALAELPKVSKPIVDALIMRRRRCFAIASLQDCVCSLRAARSHQTLNSKPQASPITRSGTEPLSYSCQPRSRPFAAESFPPTNLMARSTSCRPEFRPSLCLMLSRSVSIVFTLSLNEWAIFFVPSPEPINRKTCISR